MKAEVAMVAVARVLMKDCDVVAIFVARITDEVCPIVRYVVLQKDLPYSDVFPPKQRKQDKIINLNTV